MATPVATTTHTKRAAEQRFAAFSLAFDFFRALRRRCDRIARERNWPLLQPTNAKSKLDQCVKTADQEISERRLAFDEWRLIMSEPYCLAMVLCDGVYRDGATGKFTILGTFSTISAQEFPTKVRFCVYFEITDGHGDTKIRLRIVDAKSLLDENAQFVREMEGPSVQLQNPLMVVNGTLLVETTMPQAGLYHCELFANDVFLMSRRLLVISAQEIANNGTTD